LLKLEEWERKPEWTDLARFLPYLSVLSTDDL